MKTWEKEQISMTESENGTEWKRFQCIDGNKKRKSRNGVGVLKNLDKICRKPRRPERWDILRKYLHAKRREGERIRE